ncbi:MAG: hypothetical protein M0035_12970 [Actinomycetota bacterium]|nr:hypothetical protein [Actinomycetota bacterium]
MRAQRHRLILASRDVLPGSRLGRDSAKEQVGWGKPVSCNSLAVEWPRRPEAWEARLAASLGPPRRLCSRSRWSRAAVVGAVVVARPGIASASVGNAAAVNRTTTLNAISCVSSATCWAVGTDTAVHTYDKPAAITEPLGQRGAT